MPQSHTSPKVQWDLLASPSAMREARASPHKNESLLFKTDRTGTHLCLFLLLLLLTELAMTQMKICQEVYS